MFVGAALAVEVDDDDDDDDDEKKVPSSQPRYLSDDDEDDDDDALSVPHLIDLSKILQNLHLPPLVGEESPVNLVVMSNLH